MEEERRTLDQAIADLHDEATHTPAVMAAETSALQEHAANEFVTSTLEEAMAFLSRTIADHTIGRRYRRIVAEQREQRPCFALSRGPLCDRGLRNLMLAVGLVDGPDTPGLNRWHNDRTLVLPEGAEVEPLEQALAVLRAAHRTQCFAARPEATARLVPRLAHASHAELVALLAAAAIRDKETLAAAEQVLTQHHPACTWGALPDLAISTVASKLDGLAGLRWCTVCKAYRAAQPPVRILIIGSIHLKEEHRVEDLENPGIGGIALSFKGAHDTHRRIESISPRHAAEITHLSFAAVDPRNGPTGEPLRDHLDQPHGAHLTALRFLRVHHPAAGNTLRWHHPAAGNPGHRHTLESHIRELVLFVSSTLRDLRITAAIRLTADDLISFLPHVGPRLHHLHADLVPWVTWPKMGAGDPVDTQRLRDAVQLHCTALRSEAEVRCHLGASHCEMCFSLIGAPTCRNVCNHG